MKKNTSPKTLSGLDDDSVINRSTPNTDLLNPYIERVIAMYLVGWGKGTIRKDINKRLLASGRREVKPDAFSRWFDKTIKSRKEHAEELGLPPLNIPPLSEVQDFVDVVAVEVPDTDNRSPFLKKSVPLLASETVESIKTAKVPSSGNASKPISTSEVKVKATAKSGDDGWGEAIEMTKAANSHVKPLLPPVPDSTQSTN